jgi:hypothetical protein
MADGVTLDNGRMTYDASLRVQGINANLSQDRHGKFQTDMKAQQRDQYFVNSYFKSEFYVNQYGKKAIAMHEDTGIHGFRVIKSQLTSEEVAKFDFKSDLTWVRVERDNVLSLYGVTDPAANWIVLKETSFAKEQK